MEFVAESQAVGYPADFVRFKLRSGKEGGYHEEPSS